MNAGEKGKEEAQKKAAAAAKAKTPAVAKLKGARLAMSKVRCVLACFAYTLVVHPVAQLPCSLACVQ